FVPTVLGSSVNSDLLLFNDIFTNNIATGNGGAVYATSSQLAIFSSTFTSNTAATNGGAVFLSSGVVIPTSFSGISAGTFSNNIFGTTTSNGNQVTAAGSQGGAIYVSGAPSI